jgi:isocitrate dehydrogenase
MNVALRQLLDLYVCLPFRYFEGVPTSMKRPQDVDIVVFRENTEDIYSGLEFQYGTEENKKFMDLIKRDFNAAYEKMRFPESTGIGIKPISIEGTQRLVRAAINWSLKNHKESVTLVHNGDFMKYTEGAFKEWGYNLAKQSFAIKSLPSWNQVYCHEKKQIQNRL